MDIGFVGFLWFRFPGAIVSFFIGFLYERVNTIVNSSRKNYTYTTNDSPFFNPSAQSDLFELNLLHLSAILIKADGNVRKQELHYVRNYFISHYGQMRAEMIFSRFNNEAKLQTRNLHSICDFFSSSYKYETRLQILHFLFGLANADGSISQFENNKLKEITNALFISLSDFERIKAMFVRDATSNSYKILDVDKNITSSELKKAYREMAKKYHPDRIQSSDPAIVKGSKEKFQQVQAAYEAIKKEKGF